MSSWSSNSLTVLALATGALSSCLLALSASAGDKIEFSAPGPSLQVPQTERADKEPPKISEFQRPVGADGLFLDDSDMTSSQVMIISAPKKKEAKTWDTVFTDNRDNDPYADSTYDNVDSKPRPISRATDRWDMQRAQHSDAGNSLFERRSDRSASEDTLRTRLEAENTEGRTDYQRDTRYGRHSPDSNENAAWSHSIFDHGLTGLERMRNGQFVPFNDETKVVSQEASQGGPPARPASAEDQLLRDAALPPGVAEYNAQLDATHGKTPDVTMVAPRMYYPVQAKAVSQSSDAYARQAPPASPPDQVQSPPAILPFPKKPGDIFH